MRGAVTGKPLIIGALLTPVCLLLAIGSGGAGHGDYFYAMLLYPCTMLSALVFDSITIPFILFAVLQFPLYGALFGLAAAKGRGLIASLAIIIMHATAAALCFLLPSLNFA
ncbi:MAG TPA: hypothetical protein VIQ24_06180 [Pyrinomonadaceae bacterium]